MHRYFNRVPSEWNIIGFLNECELTSMRTKIGLYLRCLETIANTKEGERCKKAKNLLKKYREVRNFFFVQEGFKVVRMSDWWVAKTFQAPRSFKPFKPYHEARIGA